ncbi:uncharacterized protein LOC107409802 isoform X4 [Ziziphus jujuba]|uniref:Uncharacterized protein LOC107409802 isoform X4 n=1 Tax=Ziziphus jujuba TaxID=326968 RepID=A0A6P6FZ80_ZIZJJ|nr:uncharacterized protein LOC107409802 isoform X4 [Ziziphus jujuba]
MDTLLRSGWWCITITSSTRSPYPRTHSIIPRPPKPHSTRLLEAGPRAVRESAEENVLQTFFRERQLNGDFISKASDILWQREVMKFVDADAGTLADSSQQPEQVMANDNDGGFLKLSKTQEWVLGDNSAPVNKKALAKAMQDDSDKRKRLNLLRYEALKRELMFLSIGIGTACSGYCLVALSVQAAISYATGVLFRIGVRSEDVKDLLEISIKGSGIALSSPRLVIPAAIYGLWVLSHRYIVSDFLDFQILPAMFGMFVYKAAALFQVYRDNEDLQFVFPENEEGTK